MSYTTYTTYTTARRLTHKLMQAMRERDSDHALSGMARDHPVVQTDAAYLGGERPGGGVSRGNPGEDYVVATVECSPEGHPVVLRMDAVPGNRKKVLADWAKRYQALDTAAMAIGLGCSPGTTDANRVT